MKGILKQIVRQFGYNSEKVIITVNLTGNYYSKMDNKNIPMTPDEIAKDVVKCMKAGATVFNLSARDPITQQPTQDLKHLANVIKAVKKAAPEAIIQLNTGGRFDPTSAEKLIKREKIEKFKTDVVRMCPEMATFTSGSSNIDNYVDQNWPDFIVQFGKIFYETGVKATIECFDTGHLENAKFLVEGKKYLKPNLHYEFILGSSYGMPADMKSLNHMVDLVPQKVGSTWSAACVTDSKGLEDFTIHSRVMSGGLSLGGNVRTGLGDFIYNPYGKLTTNEEHVKLVVSLANEIGRKIASPKEARVILGLSEKNKNKVLDFCSQLYVFDPKSPVTEWEPSDVIPRFADPTLASQTLMINEKSVKLRKEGKTVYKVGFGESPFPIPAGVVKKLQENAWQNSYEPINGIPALREAICEHLKSKFNTDFKPDNCFVGIGTKTILCDVVRMIDAEVLIPSPAWVTYRPQSLLTGKEFQIIHMKEENNYLLTPEDLENACKKDPRKKRVLILNSPSNPTGRMYTREDYEKIVPVLKKYKIIVLADEIYGLLHENNGEAVSIAQKGLYPERSIVVNGLSKVVGGGGWRLGFGAFPEKLSFMIPIMKSIASHYYSCAPSPIQYAAVDALKNNPEVDKYLLDSRKILDPLREKIYNIFVEGKVNVVKPNSSFYIYPNLTSYAKQMKEVHGIKDGKEMCDLLLDKYGVALLPAQAFCRKPSEYSFRFCMTDFNGGKALEAVANNETIDDEFLEKYCFNVLEAARQIVKFVKTLN